MEERRIRFPKKDFEQTKIKYREAHKRRVVQQTKGHIRHSRDRRCYVDVARRESGVSVFGRRSTSRSTGREIQSTALVDAALSMSGVANFRRRPATLQRCLHAARGVLQMFHDGGAAYVRKGGSHEETAKQSNALVTIDGVRRQYVLKELYRADYFRGGEEGKTNEKVRKGVHVGTGNVRELSVLSPRPKRKLLFRHRPGTFLSLVRTQEPFLGEMSSPQKVCTVKSLCVVEDRQSLWRPFLLDLRAGHGRHQGETIATVSRCRGTAPLLAIRGRISRGNQDSRRYSQEALSFSSFDESMASLGEVKAFLKDLSAKPRIHNSLSWQKQAPVPPRRHCPHCCSRHWLLSSFLALAFAVGFLLRAGALDAWSSASDIVDENSEIVYFIQININISLNQWDKGRDKLRFEAGTDSQSDSAPILKEFLLWRRNTDSVRFWVLIDSAPILATESMRESTSESVSESASCNRFDLPYCCEQDEPRPFTSLGLWAVGTLHSTATLSIQSAPAACTNLWKAKRPFWNRNRTAVPGRTIPASWLSPTFSSYAKNIKAQAGSKFRTGLNAVNPDPSLPGTPAFCTLRFVGGTAGNVVANRLTENPHFSVLVLEAGPSPEGLINYTVPFFNVFLRQSNPRDWNYTPTAIPGRNGPVVPFPRGRLLGGSSAMNGTPFNLTYGSESGNCNPAVHGFHGINAVSLPGFTYPVVDARVKQVIEEMSDQFPFNRDYNSGSPLGVSWTQNTIKHGKRSSSFNSYLGPEFIGRPNLHVVLNAQATRFIQTSQAPKEFKTVEFAQTEEGIALDTGYQHPKKVFCRRVSCEYFLNSQRSVIISAGTVETPKLLMYSEIGESATLSKLGIQPRVHFPEVGKNLSVHMGASLPYFVNGTDTFDDIIHNLTYRQVESNERRRSTWRRFQQPHLLCSIISPIHLY
ncbi:hypothetical protein B0H14DRAFT_3708913 [Mycena olivaceomarginata]|nr:hypothetical protein B0H14DRAFT_3708913 [Mycena olivaceomarginata]